MRKILTFLSTLILTSYISVGQITGVNTVNSNYRVNGFNYYAQALVLPKISGAPGALNANDKLAPAAHILYDSTNHRVYVHNGTTWDVLGGSYSLPIASSSVLGGIKVGSGLAIDGSGVLSASGSTITPLPYLNYIMNKEITSDTLYDQAPELIYATFNGHGRMYNFYLAGLAHTTGGLIKYQYTEDGVTWVTGAVHNTAGAEPDINFTLSPMILRNGHIIIISQSGDATNTYHKHLSTDGGVTWTDSIFSKPKSGVTWNFYGQGKELADGTILMNMYNAGEIGVDQDVAYIMKSTNEFHSCTQAFKVSNLFNEVRMDIVPRPDGSELFVGVGRPSGSITDSSYAVFTLNWPDTTTLKRTVNLYGLMKKGVETTNMNVRYNKYDGKIYFAEAGRQASVDRTTGYANHINYFILDTTAIFNRALWVGKMRETSYNTQATIRPNDWGSASMEALPNGKMICAVYDGAIGLLAYGFTYPVGLSYWTVCRTVTLSDQVLTSLNNTGVTVPNNDPFYFVDNKVKKYQIYENALAIPVSAIDSYVVIQEDGDYDVNIIGTVDKDLTGSFRSIAVEKWNPGYLPTSDALNTTSQRDTFTAFYWTHLYKVCWAKILPDDNQYIGGGFNASGHAHFKQGEYVRVHTYHDADVPLKFSWTLNISKSTKQFGMNWILLLGFALPFMFRKHKKYLITGVAVLLSFNGFSQNYLRISRIDILADLKLPYVGGDTVTYQTARYKSGSLIADPTRSYRPSYYDGYVFRPLALLSEKSIFTDAGSYYWTSGKTVTIGANAFAGSYGFQVNTSTGFLGQVVFVEQSSSTYQATLKTTNANGAGLRFESSSGGGQVIELNGHGYYAGGLGAYDITHSKYLFDFDYRGSVIGNKSSRADASAVLELYSTTQGFLPPVMTKAERNAISSPATGLVIYQTDATEGLRQKLSTGWATMAGILDP